MTHRREKSAFTHRLPSQHIGAQYLISQEQNHQHNSHEHRYVVSRPSPGGSESCPLFAAVVSGDIDLVRSELQNPDNGVNTLDSNSGASPLCTAVFLGHTEIAELLINANTNVHLPNRGLSTPLHIAVFTGRTTETALLL